MNFNDKFDSKQRDLHNWDFDSNSDNQQCSCWLWSHLPLGYSMKIIPPRNVCLEHLNTLRNRVLNWFLMSNLQRSCDGRFFFHIRLPLASILGFELQPKFLAWIMVHGSPLCTAVLGLWPRESRTSCDGRRFGFTNNIPCLSKLQDWTS